jgi:hypothetical protein
MSFDPMRRPPGQDRVLSKLGAVVIDDRAWATVALDNPAKLTKDA